LRTARIDAEIPCFSRPTRLSRENPTGFWCAATFAIVRPDSGRRPVVVAGVIGAGDCLIRAFRLQETGN